MTDPARPPRPDLPRTRAWLVRARCAVLLAAGVCVLWACTAMAETAPASPYRMEAAGWVAAAPADWAQSAIASLHFARYEGMPSGAMTVNEGIAVANAIRFADGTIDFDIKPLAYSDTGIIFHRAGNDDGEFVYLRANPRLPGGR